jgi:hypothetical protein
MAARTALNNILRDARKGALLRMTAEIASRPPQDDARRVFGNAAIETPQ